MNFWSRERKFNSSWRENRSTRDRVNRVFSGVKSKGNRTKFELVGSSGYPILCYWGSTVLTIYARAAITSPGVLKEEVEAVSLTVLPAAEYLKKSHGSSHCFFFLKNSTKVLSVLCNILVVRFSFQPITEKKQTKYLKRLFHLTESLVIIRLFYL